MNRRPFHDLGRRPARSCAGRFRAQSRSALYADESRRTSGNIVKLCQQHSLESAESHENSGCHNCQMQAEWEEAGGPVE
jgi:hypothetical protein